MKSGLGEILTSNTNARGPRYIINAKAKIMTHVNMPRIIQFLHLQKEMY